MTRTPLPVAPGADDFRALACSSPWRFTTVHFIHQGARGRGTAADGTVEAWLDRSAHRVTVRSGRGVEIAEGAPYGVSAVIGAGTGTGIDTAPEPHRPASPTRRSDGLVAERPGDWHTYHGDPMWRDYQWTAMLDPAELASGVQVDDVRATTLRGRPTWTAVCRPLMGAGKEWDGGYDPRCGCCPLLDSTASRLPEYGADDPRVHADGLPTTYLVQLDVQTAIAVQVDALDGWGGSELSNEILAVDGPLAPPPPPAPPCR